MHNSPIVSQQILQRRQALRAGRILIGLLNLRIDLLAVDGHIPGGSDTDFDLVALHLQNRDLNVIVDNDCLVLFLDKASISVTCLSGLQDLVDGETHRIGIRIHNNLTCLSFINIDDNGALQIDAHLL